MDRPKLDRLTELAGEIGSVEGALDHLAEALRAHGGDPALVREAQRARSVLRRRVRELHEGLLDARMAPLDEPFARVGGVVRELAIERGRRVRLVTRGGDTRIDRALAAPVGEALTALARRAIDCEIGAPAAGDRAGRSSDATLEIAARTHGSRLRITVRHDAPGVVAQAIDDAGLDAVRELLARVGGTLAPRQGASGANSVTLELPVSVVRIPALVFEAGGCVFAIGRDAASSVRAFAPGEVERVDGREVLRDAGGVATLYRLADVLGLRATSGAGEREESHAFLLDGSGGRWALGVDRLIGRDELVVTAFGRSLRDVPALVGAADLGDGRIALVVDAHAPFDRAGDALRAREPVTTGGLSALPPGVVTGAASDAALVVEIGGGHYALPLASVREVVAAARVTRVPRAPAGVAGVISRHGAIRTVLDLPWLVGQTAPTLAENSPIVLVDLGQECVGLRVERVVRVARDVSGEAPACVRIDPAALFAARTGTPG